MKEFSVVKYADEVTFDYIKAALSWCYRGYGYQDKFSDKFIRILLSDYKRKVNNLSWFLKDEETGRILNYKTLQPSPEEVLKEAINGSDKVKTIVEWLASVDASYSADDFLNNRCVIGKQTTKITTALLKRPTDVEYTPSVFDASGSLRLGISRNVSLTTYFVDYKIPTKLSYQIDSSSNTYSTEGIVTSDERTGLLFAVIPKEYIKLTRIDALSGLSADSLSKIWSNLGASSIKVSIDLADMITAATGNCSSCISIDNVHHNGTIMNFRSDFSALCFTSYPDDRLKKHGRFWLFLRATEDGFLRRNKFFKLQKSYGSVNAAHLALVQKSVLEHAESGLGIKKAEFIKTAKTINATYCSPNVKPTGNFSHTQGAGYLDTDGESSSGYTNWYIHKDNLKMFDEVTDTPLIFPDAINLAGEVTSSPNFKREYGDRGYYGALTPNFYEVTCSATGRIVLSVDAINIKGKWYSKEALESVLDGKEIPKEITLGGGIFQVVTESVTEENVDDVDVDDF